MLAGYLNRLVLQYIIVSSNIHVSSFMLLQTEFSLLLFIHMQFQRRISFPILSDLSAT